MKRIQSKPGDMVAVRVVKELNYDYTLKVELTRLLICWTLKTQ